VGQQIRAVTEPGATGQAEPPRIARGGATSRVTRLYPALGNSSFMLMWLGNMPATLAVMMNQVVSPYAAFTLSETAAVLGVVSLAQSLPMLLLSLVGGVAADRLSRRLVMIGSQIAQGLVAAALAFLGLAGSLQVWHIIAASFVQGAGFAFNMPARQAYIAELVPRSQLANAAALNNAGQNLCRVAGPALGGALLAIPGVGIGGACLSMAGMYAAALVSLFKLPGASRPVGDAGRAGGLTHVLEGLRYVRSSPQIMSLILMNLVVVVFGMPYQTLMPVVAERVFSAGAEGLGLLLAASGAGALAGAVVVASLSRFSRPGALQLGLAIGLGVALVVFALTRSFPVAVGLLVVVGFLFSSFSALNNSLLMANTEPRLTGRVMSFYLLTWGAMPLGSLPLAWLSDRTSAPLAIALGGGIVAVVVVGVVVLLPPARRISWAPSAARP
jgi:MFS family permease